MQRDETSDFFIEHVSLQHNSFKMRGIYLFVVVLILQLHSPAICADQQVIPIDPNDTELEILREFYFATGGQNWTQQTNWLNISISKCLWFGIQCGWVDGPVVFSISLPSNNLQGTLPASFKNLTVLAQLYLSSNALTGTLPHFIAQMPSLAFLDLNSNQFTGTIPEEYGSMSQMLGMPTSVVISFIYFFI